jgi:hypothetical protein
LLKRISYQHEHEVRAFIGRVPENLREAANIEYWKPAPIRMAVKVSCLIKAIHVSPYPGEPFASSVKKISELFRLPDGTVRLSKLLSGHEELLDRLTLLSEKSIMFPN